MLLVALTIVVVCTVRAYACITPFSPDAAEVALFIDIRDRIVAADPNKVTAQWRVGLNSATLCDMSGITCNLMCRVTEFVMIGGTVWVDDQDQNPWDIGVATQFGQPFFHVATELSLLTITVTAGSTGYVPGSTVRCGVAGSLMGNDLPYGIETLSIIGDPLNPPTAITALSSSVFAENFFSSVLPCYFLDGMALTALPSVALNLNDADGGGSSIPIVRPAAFSAYDMPLVSGTNVAVFPTVTLFAVKGIDSITFDTTTMCTNNDIETLATSIVVQDCPSFVMPSCFVDACHAQSTLFSFTSIDNANCYIGQDLADDVALSSVYTIFSSPFLLTALVFGLDLNIGSQPTASVNSCVMTRENELCIDCYGNGRPPEFSPDYLIDRTVVEELRTRITAADPSKVSAAWQTPVTADTMCTLPGISCDLDCRVTVMSMFPGTVWVDDTDQNPWDVGLALSPGAPNFHRLTELRGLTLTATSGSTGFLPGSRTDCSGILTGPGNDLPVGLESFSFFGDAANPPVGISAHTPGVFEKNTMSIFPCYYFDTLTLTSLPSVAIDFNAAADTPLSIVVEQPVNIRLMGMPLVTGTNITPNSGVELFGLLGAGNISFDEQAMCVSGDIQTIETQITVQDTPSFVPPSCFIEACAENSVFSFVSIDNGNCFVGQQPDQDVSLTPDFTLFNSVFVLESLFLGIDIDFSNQSTHHFDSCTITRDNLDCIDCFGEETPPDEDIKVLDLCGVCSGDSSTCTDCLGQPAGPATYDACDVCDGSNDCVDCAGIAYGTAEYDLCDVCCGDNECVDCAGVVNGSARVDRCGECDGDNACAACKESERDICGVCHGDGTSCLDCACELHGTAVYDACDVCGGDGLSCADCKGTPYGSADYDACDVCGGNDSACKGCDGIPNSCLVYDQCGVCGGNDECVDCEGRVCGLSVEDACGVCNGHGESCSDCAGVPHGPRRINVCLQCVDPAEHPLDRCDHNQLLHDAHSRLTELSWLAIIVAALLGVFTVAACGAFGGACIGVIFRCCSRREAHSRDGSLLDDHIDAERAEALRAEKARKRAAKKASGGGGGGSKPSAALTVAMVVCLASGVSATPARNQPEVLYDEMCASTSFALSPALCGASRGNACSDWPDMVECYDGTSQISSVSFPRSAFAAGDVLSRRAWRSMRTAEQINIAGIALADWTDDAGYEPLFRGFVRLRRLDLDHVNVRGVALPASIANAVGLERLRISDAPELVGTTDVLCSLPRLEEIVLRRTSVGGALACAGYERAWLNLHTIDVRGSRFESPLPDLSLLVGLERLFADNNRLGGAFPDPSTFPPSLLELCLAENDFNGSLPTGWDSALPLLATFFADGNQLSGAVPLFNFAEMTRFGISNNDFDGSLPDEMTDSPGYLVLRINNNQLFAPFPPFVEDQLCGECALQCNALCSDNPYINSPNYQVLLSAGCSVSVEFADYCDGGCGDRSCLGCDGIPNSGAVLDECGVCAGDNTACCDCAGEIHGTSVADACGVCNGDSTSCADCAGEPNGSAFYDVCGVCGGDGLSCRDCAGEPNGSAALDACGVCDGGNRTCVDCGGVVNGPSHFDELGVCNGTGIDSTHSNDAVVNELANVDTSTTLAASLIALAVFGMAMCCGAFTLCAISGRFDYYVRKAKRDATDRTD